MVLISDTNGGLLKTQKKIKKNIFTNLVVKYI
jgi:hypothetical protein